MPKRRNEIAMTGEEQHALLPEGHTLQVSTIQPDGRPHLAAMWYALLDGNVAFGTYAKSQKVVNLRRDPRITLMIEDGRKYDEVRGLVIEGRAEIVEDNPELAARVLNAGGRHEPGDLPTGEMPEAAIRAATKRALIIVHPERTYSWDHGKLGGTY